MDVERQKQYLSESEQQFVFELKKFANGPILAVVGERRSFFINLHIFWRFKRSSELESNYELQWKA